MHTTLGNLKAAEPALKKLLNSDLPVKTAFLLAKLVHEANAELATAEEQRIKLVKRHGLKDDATDNWTVTKENLPAFQQEYESLAGVPIHLKYEPVTLEALGEVKMTPVEMSLLDGFLIP